MTCGEVERLFTRNVGQSSLVVTDAAGAPMLVDRTAFLDTMVGRNGYGRPLYHQEPIAIDTRGYYARTFAIAPGGRLMVVGNMQPLVELDGTTLRTVPANLALFRIGDDGRLDYVRKYDVEVGADSMFWSGIVERAAQ